MSIYTEEAERRFAEIARRIGYQPGIPGKVNGFDLFNLTCDVAGHSKGDTLRKETIMALLGGEKA